ncbi:MAG: aminotransferase class I/II-fold pyridoxal phosphate-dependent enzyme, partial [Anaerolineales bacterium]|nr:aminotransferase class I/II-fold pyridoxal phosphate-dependent enzyme [Anaerolineales bacterium]
MKRAVRIQGVADYPFARWNRLIHQACSRGQDVIRLDVGDPDLPPPEEVVQTLASSANQIDNHGYPGYRGLPVLREAMADYYRRRFDVALDPESEILPLIGSKEGIINLSLSCLDPGDLVLVPDPGYAPYAVGATLAGAEVFRFTLDETGGWRPDFASIPTAAADKATLLWLNYPNNPTGATVDLDFLVEAVNFAVKHDILLCHDAPYCDVTYDGYSAPSVLQVPGAASTAVEFNSLSKSWNMAGWRVAMAVGNADVLLGLTHVKSNTD